MNKYRWTYLALACAATSSLFIADQNGILVQRLFAFAALSFMAIVLTRKAAPTERALAVFLLSPFMAYIDRFHSQLTNPRIAIDVLLIASLAHCLYAAGTIREKSRGQVFISLALAALYALAYAYLDLNLILFPAGLLNLTLQLSVLKARRDAKKAAQC